MTKNVNLIDKCRAAFEESMSSQGEWPQAVERFADGGYKLATTATAWQLVGRDIVKNDDNFIDWSEV